MDGVRGAWELPATGSRYESRLHAPALPPGDVRSTGDALRIPGVRLAPSLPQPEIQGVVHHETVAQLLVVIVEEPGEAEGDCEQPRTLRRERETISIGAADDGRQIQEGRLVQSRPGQDGVEGTARPFVAELDTLDVERGCASLPRDPQHVARRDEQELRLVVDEPPDEPWTGDPIDLWPGSRHPLHRSLQVDGSEGQ